MTPPSISSSRVGYARPRADTPHIGCGHARDRRAGRTSASGARSRTPPGTRSVAGACVLPRSSVCTSCARGVTSRIALHRGHDRLALDDHGARETRSSTARAGTSGRRARESRRRQRLVDRREVARPRDTARPRFARSARNASGNAGSIRLVSGGPLPWCTRPTIGVMPCARSRPRQSSTHRHARLAERFDPLPEDREPDRAHAERGETVDVVGPLVVPAAPS